MIASDSPPSQQGQPWKLGADPGSADSSTGLASLHPSSDPKPCGQRGGSSCKGHWLPEEPQPQLPPGGEGNARPRVHTHAHTHPEAAGVSETFKAGEVIGRAQFGGPHHEPASRGGQAIARPSVWLWMWAVLDMPLSPL